MKKIIFALLLSLLFCSSVSAETVTEESSITTRASSVFESYGAGINRSYYGGDCALLGVGSGSVQIILQKQNETNKAWYTYDSQSSTKYFLNTSVCSYSKSYILPAGSFRCKTIVTATLNGVTETKTVYSPVLTVY